MMKKTLATAATVALTASTSLPTTLSAQAETTVETTQLLVQHKENAEISTKQAKALNAEIVSEHDQTTVIDVAVSDVDEVVETLEADKDIEFVEENKIYTIADDTAMNDEFYTNQWNLKAIDTENAWKQAEDASKEGVTVAVLDTGVKATHTDLAGRVLEGATFVDNAADNKTGNDDQGHGTFVSGIIAANANNEKGIAGVAGKEDVTILPVKVMAKNGEGTANDIAEGIRYAIDQKVDVINMSLSGEYSEAIDTAVQEAAQAGIVVVAASGNGGGNADTNYPAALDNVLSIGSVSKSDQVYAGSNTGETVDLVAPGVGVVSTSLAGDLGDETGYYTTGTGTSYAAPHVAAVAALYKAQHKDASANEVSEVLTKTATDLNTEGHDRETGYGKVNAAKALENNVSIDAFTVNAPKKNADVIGVTPISVSTANDAVQTMSVFVGDKEVATGTVKDHQFTSSFDTTAFADGDYTVTVKAYDKDGVELDASERTIHIKNAPVSGYMFSVQSPNGNVAKGATVKLYEKDDEGHYSELWTGGTDNAGAVRVPSYVGTDLKDVRVVVQGKFDDAEGKNSWFMYSRELNTTGAITLTSDDTQKVALETTGKDGKGIDGAQYFITMKDDEGNTVGEMTDINKLGASESPTVYLDKGAYNIFAYAKQDGDTYFLSKTDEKITAPGSLTFDTAQAGQITVNNDNGKLENAVLYVYNDAMNEAFGEGIATGRNFYVTPGDYQYLIDAEVADDTNDGKGNWIYSFAETTKATVKTGETTKLQAGGQVDMTLEADQEAVARYAKQRNVAYIERDNANDAYKADQAFYTKQMFSDAYGNQLVGMKRGSLTEEDALYKKDVETGKTEIKADDEEWKIESKDFGNIYANYNIKRNSDGKVLLDSDTKNATNPANRMYYMYSFIVLTSVEYTQGTYDITVSAKPSPLTRQAADATKGLEKTLTMNLVDSGATLTLKDKAGQNVATYTTLLRAEKDENGNIEWNQYYNRNSDSTKVLNIPDNLKTSSLEGGNIAIIRYNVPNSGGKFGFIYRQFDELSDLQQDITIPENMTEVTVDPKDGDQAMNNISTKLLMIKKKVTVDGQEAYPTANTLQVYKHSSVFLEAEKDNGYVIEGNYVTLPDAEGKQDNYYFLNDKVTVDDTEGANNTVTFNKQDLAQVKIKADTEGFKDFRGAILYPYNKYSDSFTTTLRTGHNFYVPADLKMNMQVRLGFGDTENNNKIWNYYFSKGTQSFTTGDVSTWKVGGQLTTEVELPKTTYKAGEEVSASAHINDAYGNQLSSVLVNQTNDYTIADEEEQGSYVLRNGQVSYEVAHGSETHAAVSGSVKPVASIIDAEGNVVSKASDEMFYNHIHGLNAPTQAGDYTLQLAIAGSPLGAVKSATKFKVAASTVIVPPVAPTPNAQVSDKTGVITGKTTPGATVVVKVGNKVIGEATANEAGNFTIKVPKQAADTKLTLIASKDGKETVTTITVIDKTAPKVTSVKASNKTNKIVVKTEKGATIKLTVGGKTYTKKANKDGEYTFTIKNLKGNAKWRMTVTDTAGNETKKTGKVVDAVAPAKPKVTTKVKSSTKTIKGTAEAGSRVYLYKHSKVIATAKTDKKGNYVLRLPKQKAATTLYVKAKDSSSNYSKGTKIIVAKSK